MNYVFLVYGDAAAEAALSAEQRATLARPVDRLGLHTRT